MSDNNNNNGKDKVGKTLLAAAIATFVVLGLGLATTNILLILVGAILIITTVIFGAATANKDQKLKNSIRPDMNRYYKYMPLLTDERTKQHPEVQRLLQYTEVQRAFFDPHSLASPTTGNDEHVQELLRVFDEILAQGGINGNIYGDPQNISQAPIQNGAMPSDPFQKMREDEEKKKPIRKVGKIMRWVGVGMFTVPFVLVFVLAGLNPGSSVSMTAVSFAVSGACPMGMLLIIVGSFLGR